MTLSGAFISLHLLDAAFPPPLEVRTSAVVLDAGGVPLRVFPVEDGRWRLKARAEELDPRLIEALLAVEDKRFFEHRGVDLCAVGRAALTNLRAGTTLSGASTITMQTARLLEPRPRNLPSKLIEMLRARQIERRLSKEEILGLYLTLTPYGGNLEGVETASLAYFGKAARQLSDSEIALLLALPQSPEARRPDRQTAGAKAGRAAVLAKLERAGMLSADRADEADHDPLPTRRRNFPAGAWHAAARFAEDGGRVTTTIEADKQQALRRILVSLAEAEGPDVQAAGMIVRLDTREVVASVGSTHRRRPGGWLDLTSRRRSPGSTLKPFVYGLAMQEGLVSEEMRIADLPTRFGTYEPQNFSRDFAGELTVGDALRHSLNVPAVLILDALGADRLLGSMRSAGVRPLVPVTGEREAGLAVTLGGVGVTLEELALLYTALGAEGLAAPLRYRLDEKTNDPARLMGQDAAARTLRMLRASPSVEGRIPPALATDAPQVAFKTGTSYGYRDAWAAGVGERYAAVVWAGRADGSARPGRTGRAAALPALLDVFDQLGEGSGKTHPGRAAVPSSDRVLTGAAELEITFPPDGASLPTRARSYVLAGRGRGELRWYVDGEMLSADENRQVHWRPPGPGFYSVALADDEGRRTEATVRVIGSKS
nr:penicillin-binding protein 1C [Parvularcula maris]